MKLFFDFFPIIVFFISYKLWGIYAATALAIGSSFAQVIFYRFKYQLYEKMHLLSLALISTLGGATLIFRDPWFIKWKPTGIYWLTALVVLGSSFFGSKPFIQKMMDSNISLPNPIWHRLNYAWVIFFLLMGSMNLYVAYYYSTDAWVNFKLFGGAGFTLGFVFLQALYLARHLTDTTPKPLATTNQSTLKNQES